MKATKIHEARCGPVTELGDGLASGCGEKDVINLYSCIERHVEQQEGTQASLTNEADAANRLHPPNPTPNIACRCHFLFLDKDNRPIKARCATSCHAVYQRFESPKRSQKSCFRWHTFTVMRRSRVVEKIGYESTSLQRSVRQHRTSWAFQSQGVLGNGPQRQQIRNRASRQD